MRLVSVHFLQESRLLHHIDHGSIHASDMGHINTDECAGNRTMERNRNPADQCELTSCGSDAQQAEHLHIFVQHDQLRVCHARLREATLADDATSQRTKADPCR